MHVELGGPDIKEKFELARVKKPEEVEDGKVIVIGPDLKDMEEEKSYPLEYSSKWLAQSLNQNLKE